MSSLANNVQKAMDMLDSSDIYRSAMNCGVAKTLISEYMNSKDKTGDVMYSVIEALMRRNADDVARGVLVGLKMEAVEFIQRQGDAKVPLFIQKVADSIEERLTYKDVETYLGNYLLEFFKIVKQRKGKTPKKMDNEGSHIKQDPTQMSKLPTPSLFGFVRFLGSKALLINKRKLSELTVSIKYDMGRTLVVPFLKSLQDLKLLTALEIRQTLLTNPKSKIQYSFLLLRESDHQVLQDTDRIWQDHSSLTVNIVVARFVPDMMIRGHDVLLMSLRGLDASYILYVNFEVVAHGLKFWCEFATLMALDVEVLLEEFILMLQRECKVDLSGDWLAKFKAGALKMVEENKKQLRVKVNVEQIFKGMGNHLKIEFKERREIEKQNSQSFSSIANQLYATTNLSSYGHLYAIKPDILFIRETNEYPKSSQTDDSPDLFTLLPSIIKVTAEITYKLSYSRRLHSQNPVDSTTFGGPKTAPDSLFYTKWQVTDELLYELLLFN